MGVHASPARLKRELAAASPMQSDKPKRDLADFFKPYARHGLPSAIPQKRASPPTDSLEQEHEIKSAKLARTDPKTPTRIVAFKDVTPTSQSTVKRAIFTPKTDAALPIRSPKVVESPTRPATDSRQRTLFQTSSPPKPLRPIEAGDNLNISFALSDISDRSQSVFKDGKVIAVRDSDDDDTDSLVSLDDLLSFRDRGPPLRVSANISSQDSSQDETIDNEAQRISILAKFTRGQSVPIVGKEKIREFYAKQRNLKFDLSAILDDHFGDLEAVEKARQARAESDGEGGDDQELTETDKKLLADIVRNGGEDVDAEDVERVLSAVERTEALVGEKRFSFFDWRGMQDRRAHIAAARFPAQAIPDHLWREDDDDMCARAFLSGIVTEKAAMGRLDDQALKWIFGEAVRQPQSDLRQTYLRTVNVASTYWTRLHVSATDIQRLFQELGAAPEVLGDKNPITSKHHIDHKENGQSPAHLLAILELLQAVCGDLDMLALSKVCSILLRLCLDDTVMSDGRAASKVEGLLETLLNLTNNDARMHVYSHLLEDGVCHVKDHILQAKLLSRLPVSSSTTGILRKTLADVFLIGDSTLNHETMTSNASLSMLNKQINTHNAFTITRKPHATPNEYATLTALLTVLDVAIGVGYTSFDHSHSASNTATPVMSRSEQSKIPSGSDVKAFNAAVDALSDSIHAIFVSIKDTGASHMRRTEAKDALQALEYRCLYGVRIGVRKKKHVFDVVRESSGMDSGSNSESEVARKAKIIGMGGDEFRERERGREAMSKFLSRVKSQRNDSVGNKVLSVEQDQNNDSHARTTPHFET